MVVQWNKSKYRREENNTWRDANTGAVFDNNGKFLGFEKRKQNYFGDDPKKRKLKKGQKKPIFKRR